MQMQMQMRTYTDAIKMQITCTDMCVFNICPLSHIGPLRGGQNTNLTITTEKLMKKGVDLPAKTVGLSEPRGLAEGGGCTFAGLQQEGPQQQAGHGEAHRDNDVRRPAAGWAGFSSPTLGEKGGGLVLWCLPIAPPPPGGWF